MTVLEIFNALPTSSEEGRLKVYSGDCVLTVEVKSGYVLNASINGERVEDPVNLIGFLISILGEGKTDVRFDRVEVRDGDPIIPLDLMVLYVSSVMDEIAHFGPSLPSSKAFLRVLGVPSDVSTLGGKFLRYIAKRFGVGMWVPIKRIPLSSCLNENFVRYLVLVASEEFPDLIEVRQLSERRYDMQGKLQELLKKLVEDSPDIIGVVIATMDGLPISHYSSYAYDPEIQAAISSAIVTLSESSVRDANLGDTSEILIVAEKGKVFLYPLGDLVLGVLADRDANTGMIFMKVRKVLGDIQEAALKEIEIG